MPIDKSIKKTLVIGSGPIIIGQAAEFDYSGSQACRALKEDGIEVVLINSNPATIMTDKDMASKIYIEPLTRAVVERIIEKERPDSLLPTLGGQTGLNLSMELHESGVLDKYGIRLLGATPETIAKAEDRELFKEAMLELNMPCVPSKIVTEVSTALDFAEEIGYPVIVRPAYTLGGSGGGMAETSEELEIISANGLRASRVSQILIEKCISGWKEIEFEVVRDRLNNRVIVCSMENIDPVGVHTGDSIVAAPAQTLAPEEYQVLRLAALDIVTGLELCGACNVQLAIHPESSEYAVIEVNPRVSRSSALASKATGYPIAKVATKIAIGHTLDEIKNSVTGTTSACFEPTIDYTVLKFPRFPFDKFVYARKRLGTQMQATGEVMAIGTSFEMALMKAVRGVEKTANTLHINAAKKLSNSALIDAIGKMDDDRLFYLYEAIARGMELGQLNELTGIDVFFLNKLKNIWDMEQTLKNGNNDSEDIEKALSMGFTYTNIQQISGKQVENKRHAVYKMVDTCAGEFEATTPYYYSTYDETTDVEVDPKKKKVLVIGSGSIRIGQGIEFDYCTVHGINALKEMGYEAIIANNNPETVSTDCDISDRLYFDPLTPDDLDNIINTEKPDGVIVQFGGQTAIKLAAHLSRSNVKILGTSYEMVDAAEDREKFDALLEKCGIMRPKGLTVLTTNEAISAAEELGFPVLLRPSYVLGGQNMIIAYNSDDVAEYVNIITAAGIENPILIDKYIMGREVEVDAVCDGKDILIPGIMEHIERAGVHSGDSISVYPTQNVEQKHKTIILDYTQRLARALSVVGMINIQYIIHEDNVYVIEVNPRCSRTVPYISKVTGVPVISLATRCMLGHKLEQMGYGTGIYPESSYVAVKVPVFSFEKLHDVDTHLGPEMKSTGEALGIARTFDHAMQKGFCAAGLKFAESGKVIITVRNSDKAEMLPIAKKLSQLNFQIYATNGTKAFLDSNGVPAMHVMKISEGEDNIITLLEKGVDYIISTSEGHRTPERHSVKIRRKAVECATVCLTSVDTAKALVNSLAKGLKTEELEMISITDIAVSQ